MAKNSINFFFKRFSTQFVKYPYLVFEHLFKYPVSWNLGIMWNYGFIAMIFLFIQIITGFFLSTHYVASSDFAFVSVEEIMRDVNYGWFLRYLHSNGASFFFLSIFFHILRSLKYFSYLGVRKDTWLIGIFMFFLTIMAAFTGYVLPWGQMSFWAATVITNLFSAIPFFGEFVVSWLWGAYSVSTYTLNRFFSLHFVIPFFILGLSFFHILFLHEFGGNNKFKATIFFDKVFFYPFYLLKDLYFINLFFIIYFFFIGFAPNYLSHPDNYIKANPLVTPEHIVPEWYFLLFYAILRSVPSKLGGIMLLLLSIFILVLIPFFFKMNNSFFFKMNWDKMKFSYLNKKNFFLGRIFSNFKRIFFLKKDYLFWIFIITVFLLSFVGSQPIEEPFLLFGRILTFLYFYYFIYLGILDLYYNYLITKKITLRW